MKNNYYFDKKLGPPRTNNQLQHWLLHNFRKFEKQSDASTDSWTKETQWQNYLKKCEISVPFVKNKRWPKQHSQSSYYGIKS